MSTFSNTPFPRPTAEGHAFATVSTDDVLVQNFRTGDAEATRARLNTDLQMQLSEHAFARIQAYFRDTARRDPTVGELRLLDALDRHGRNTPARIAVGEFLTASPMLAETWADMMQKHGALHGVGHTFRGKDPIAAPPCSLTEALALIGRYLHTLETARAPSRLLLSSPSQEAMACAEGYTPVACMTVGEETLSAWTRRVAVFPVAPPRTGDCIFYLPRADLSKVQALLEEEAQKARPALQDIRAVAEKSLLLTLGELCPGVDLYAHRFTADTPADGTLPVDTLCAFPTVEPNGVCDFLLLVSVKQMQTVNASLKRLDISATVCGQVRKDGNTVIHVRDGQNVRDIPAAKLPTAFLSAMSPVYLHRFKAELSRSVATSPTLVPITRLPSSLPRESGLTPDRLEAVALTLHEGQILPIPEANALMATASSVLRKADMAFSQAAETVVRVTDRLISADVAPENMVLSVALTVPSSEALKDGAVLSAIMGIYRVAAERGLPVEDPAITVAPTKGLLRVTVTAHAEDENGLAKQHGCSADRQWRASGKPCHKESPGFLLPVVHRPYEGCLKALSAALNRDDPARCIIHPIIMDEHEIEIPTDSDTPRKETRYSLNPDSVKKLCEQMQGWVTPIFCMSEADTRMLLFHPTVAEALHRMIDMGYPVIVLGQSCKPFAEQGLLPSVLASVGEISVKQSTATVTYTFPAEPSTRLIRGRLLAPKETAAIRHLLNIRLPGGVTIPDGFISTNGKVLGILNGVDTTVLPILRKHNFEI